MLDAAIISVAEEAAQERAARDQTFGRRGLARRTLGAIGLTFLVTTSGRLLTTATTFVLARLLTPDEFGVANLGAVLLALALPITDIGIAQALVRGQKDDLVTAARTAFWLVNLLGVALYALCLVAARPLAVFYTEPDLAPVLQVIGISIVIYAVSRIPSALLERELLYKAKVVPELAGSFVYALLAIALAAFGFGFWSIVLATVARMLVISVGLFAVTRWRPGVGFDVRVAQELISYARVLLASSMLRLAYTNVDNMIVGKVQGTTPLGYYAMAYNLGNLPATQIAGAVGTGLFPAYARMLPDEERIRGAMLLILRYTGLVISPITIVGIVATPILVPVVLGPKWIPMTPALQVLLIYGWLRTIAPVYWMLILAADLRRHTLAINLWSLVVALAFALPVVHLWGFVGIAVEFTVLEVFRTAWMALSVRNSFHVSSHSQLRQLWPGLGASAMAALVLAGGLALLPPLNTVAALGMVVGAGVVYLLLLVLLGQLGREQLMLAGALLQKR
jgi:PST family polysaccharide transporter